jgi:hypothetical protein
MYWSEKPEMSDRYRPIPQKEVEHILYIVKNNYII